MIIDMSYWARVGKRILYVILILAGLYISFHLSILTVSISHLPN